MPVNKLALIRYKAIDRCLQNHYRKWTLDDLVAAVSEAVYEFEGIKSGVGKRTVQLDIQHMRSERFGFNAPIVVVERKFYIYEDRNYSISNTPISEYDVSKLKEVVGLMRQLKGLGYFQDLSTMVARLEDKILKQGNEGRSYIDLDKNEQLKGLEYIELIHAAILKKTVLLIEYQSFKAREAKEEHFHPHLLKQYNNRWFVLGSFKKSNTPILLALDRINSLREDTANAYRPASVDVFTYFDDVIGVSKTMKQRASNIVLRLRREQLPYLTTKPLHPSQTILKEEEGFVLINIKVIWNYELEREIIGMGELVEVLSPRRLREKIANRLGQALSVYKTEED
ncbi:MAG: WYL domain-containing protein [Bacteroidetes bacterium]|nr:WYL domain-containing protein [Bacteroidota bacterium]